MWWKRLWNLSEPVQGTIGHHGAKAKGCQRHCVYVCGADRVPTPGNDVAAQQNEQAVYVPYENYRNPSREAKHQCEILKDYFNHLEGTGRAGQDLRCVNQQPWGQKLASISPF